MSHLLKASWAAAEGVASKRGGAGPCSVPKGREGHQCHQQQTAVQQIELQCRCVVKTHRVKINRCLQETVYDLYLCYMWRLSTLSPVALKKCL